MSQATSDDITLADLWHTLLYHRWLVIGGTLLGTILALVVAFTTQPVYRAEALLAPVSPDAGSGSNSLLSGQLGGLASLAGVSLGPGNDRKVEALAVLKSRALTYAFVTEAELLPILFAEDWDAEHARWKADDPGEVPGLWEANELFASELRKVIEDKDTGLVTLAIEWGDPELAAAWVNELIVRTNDRLRSSAIEHAERNIAYLKKQIEQTNIIEVRQSSYRLIESEIKTVMMAQGSDEYAFKVIDPPVVPQDKVRPMRSMIVAAGLVSGFVLSCIPALVLGGPRRG
jgi:uncharacterized protein involved in exopolysaccharide biosynthesis